MLAEAFYWLLNMSIVGSAVGLIILLLRRIRPLPRRLVCWLWLIPLLRFWLPISFASQFSLINLLAGVTVRTIPVFTFNDTPLFYYSNFVQAAGQYNPLIYKTDALATVFTVCSLIWVVVFLALLLTMLLLYRFSGQAIRQATLVQDNVYRSAHITAPAVYGIFKPRIIVPNDLPDEDLAFVLLHENAHIQRRDNLLRAVALTTACLHWFNPLAWVYLKLYFADMELACDARVLRQIDRDGQKAYATALLRCAAGPSLFVSAFGGARIRVRLEHILSYRKLTLAAGLVFALLVLVVAVALLSNAQT